MLGRELFVVGVPSWALTSRLHHFAFHLTLPTHLAHLCTSSLPLSRSTVYQSFANSSFPAIPCTKLWHALHNHATLFSTLSSCQPRFSTRSCTDFGMRWWYVRGIQSRSQISQAEARVLDQTGGGPVVAAM